MKHKKHIVNLTSGNVLTLVDTDAIQHELSYYDSGVLRIIETTFTRPDPAGKRELEARRTTHYSHSQWVSVVEDWDQF